jgi:hypothetical protein
MSNDDDRIDSLLAQGALGGPARERILDRALSAAAPRRRRWSRWLALAIPAAAVMLFFALRPRPAFTPKGGRAGALLDVNCGDTVGRKCARGSTLLFQVGGAAQSGVLLAWAEPKDGGERIWYFPDNNGEVPQVRASSSLQTLARGIRIGPEHAAGDYMVHIVLARRPLTRAEALAASPKDVVDSATVPLEVLP